MKAKELRKKSKADLEKLLTKTQDDLRLLRFKKAGGELKNVRELAKTRRLIARILTILNHEE